jgi:hypothetical protein
MIDRSEFESYFPHRDQESGQRKAHHRKELSQTFVIAKRFWLVERKEPNTKWTGVAQK